MCKLIDQGIVIGVMVVFFFVLYVTFYERPVAIILDKWLFSKLVN